MKEWFETASHYMAELASNRTPMSFRSLSGPVENGTMKLDQVLESQSGSFSDILHI